MMKKKSLYIFACFALYLTSVVQAQTSTILEQHNIALSPSEKRFEQQAINMDILQLRALYENPSYAEWTCTHDSIYHPSRYRSSVYTGYSKGDMTGDFLPSEGNTFSDYRLGATGEYSIKKAGVLYGSLQYARGEHRNYGWNAVRHYELYAPYIATDSIGGDYHYEDYFIEGGYAFTLNTWKIGVSGLFHGEQAHRKTDPRALNKTTWLNFGVGVSQAFNGHLVMLHGNFGRNKQHLHLRYWRPGEQDRFFICYGFGLYDLRRSKVSFGYERMYYLTEANARLTYQSPSNKPLKVFVSLGYEFDRMKSEETDICNLYFSKTSTMLPSIKFDWKVSQPITLSLWMDGHLDFRKGYENIYERYLADKENNIYDNRKIDTQQNYHFNHSDLTAQIRVNWQVTPEHSLALTGGISSSSREETFQPESFKIANHSLFPHGQLNYRLWVKHSELNLSCLYGKQFMINSSYELPLVSGSVKYLNFQHGFTPYAYYNSSWSSLQATASYIYHFNRCALGLNGRVLFTQGMRNKDTFFDGKIGYDSTAPKISKAPDCHNELWFSTSLFLVF